MTPEEIEAARVAKEKKDAAAAAAAAVNPQTQMRDEISKGLAGLMAPKNEDPMARSKNNAITIAALRGSRRDMSGNLIDETTGMAPAGADPFRNDMFQSRDQRIMKEQAAFGGNPNETYTGKGRGYLDAQGVTDQMRKQGQASGGVITEGPDQDPSPFKGLMTPMLDNKGKQTGTEYMLNPNLPADKRFQGANMGQISGGRAKNTGVRNSNVPTITDENGPQLYPPTAQIQGYPEGPQQFDAFGQPISSMPGTETPFMQLFKRMRR